MQSELTFFIMCSAVVSAIFMARSATGRMRSLMACSMAPHTRDCSCGYAWKSVRRGLTLTRELILGRMVLMAWYW